MKTFLCAVFACVVLCTATFARGDALKSGLQEGEHIGAFIVEKCAGNPDDGVPQGEKLCYRCMLGSRPVVAVFARDVNGELASLVKQLDQAVAKNSGQKLASFVNLLGSDPQQLKSAAQSLIDESQAKNVAVVVPRDYEKGPDNLKLNPDADVTVLIYRDGKVEANHALAPGQLDDAAIARIVQDTGKILK